MSAAKRLPFAIGYDFCVEMAVIIRRFTRLTAVNQDVARGHINAIDCYGVHV